MSILARARRVGPARRSLVYEAILWTVGARVAVACVPFRWIAPRLGTPTAETSATLTEGQARHASLVAWALSVVGRELPWLGRCLARAIAGKMMLKRRGVPSTLYLGVRRQQSLEAHAWLRCGDRTLTGAEDRPGFTVVMVLGDPSIGPTRPIGGPHAAG